jgi:hypothetical protein
MGGRRASSVTGLERRKGEFVNAGLACLGNPRMLWRVTLFVGTVIAVGLRAASV